MHNFSSNAQRVRLLFLSKEKKQKKISAERKKCVALKIGCLKLTYQDEFSSLKVVHRRSHILAKSRAGSYKFGFQGQFSEEDDKTLWNYFEARHYNSGLGRWMIPDPASQFNSPYSAMANQPNFRVDPDGRVVPIILVAMVVSSGVSMIKAAKSGGDVFAAGIKGAVLGSMNAATGGMSGVMLGTVGAIENKNTGRKLLGVGASIAMNALISQYTPIGTLDGIMYGGMTGSISSGVSATIAGTEVREAMLVGGISGSIMGGVNGYRAGKVQRLRDKYTEKLNQYIKKEMFRHENNIRRWKEKQDQDYLETLTVCNGCGPTASKPQYGAAGYQYSLTGSAVFGYTVSFGYLGNANGMACFLTYGKTRGFDISFDASFFAVTSHKPFSLSDFKGTGFTRAAGIGTFGAAYSGNTLNEYANDSWPYSYKVYEVGASIGLPGGSQSKTNTIILDYPQKVMEQYNPYFQKSFY